MDFAEWVAADWVTAVATTVIAAGGLLEGYLYIRFAKRKNTLDVIKQVASDPVIREYQKKIKDKARRSEDGKVYDYSTLTQDDRMYVSRIMDEYETISLSV